MDMEGNEEYSTAMDVPELIPMEDYDSKQARVEASISWLVTKAYGRNIPKDFIEAFYIDKYNEQSLKPKVVSGLTSAEIYCRACANIFRDTTNKWDGHSSVIQALSRRGIYVMDPFESAVTDSVLQQNAPLKLHSHLALIDALMTAYATETVTIERVVQSVRKFATFNASSELPYDTEDALLFWINKVCSTVRHRLQKAQGAGHGIPVMDDILKDINDGCCLATLCSFYCPNTLSLHDIALKDDCGVADSMYNLQLVIQFCESLPTRCLHLSLNDLFYSQEEVKRNIIVFLSELFFWFEVSPAPIVADVTRQEVSRPASQVIPSEGEVDDGGRPSTAKQLKSTGRPPVPISAVTKRSFQQSDGGVSSSSTPDLHKAANTGTPVPARQQPLLPRRQNQRSPGEAGENGLRRCNSLGLITPVEDDPVRQSAWEDASEGEPGLPGARRGFGEPQRAMASSSRNSQLTTVTRDSQRSDLLNNVSIDSSMSLDMGASSSLDMSELEDTPRKTPVGPIVKGRPHLGAPVQHARTPQHRNDMDLESVGSNSRATTAGSARRADDVEPLMPAQLKPSKEKTNIHTKEVESGEKAEKKSPSSPVRPPKTLPIKQPVRQVPINNDSDSDSTPSEEYQTPSVESVPLPGTMNESPKRLRNTNIQQNLQQSTDTGRDTGRDTSQSRQNTHRAGSAFDRSNPLSQSFTLHNQAPKTPEEAKAAGIPVVDDYRFNRQHPASLLRGERTERSSSEGSDPELRKINADHKDREHKAAPGSGREHKAAPGTDATRPASLNVTKRVLGPGQADTTRGQRRPAEKPSPITSFAQIKKEKENGEVSSSLYGETGGETDGDVNSGGSLKEQFQKSKAKGPKKTTFAALPNQTSWQETAQKSAKPNDKDGVEGEDTVQPLTSELVNIRMRLEERRRQIETDKKRMEMQWNKQRQRVGKQAFIQVISKGKSTESSPADGKVPEEPKMMVRSAEEIKSEPQPPVKVSPRRGSEELHRPSRQESPPAPPRDSRRRSAEVRAASPPRPATAGKAERAAPGKAEPQRAAPVDRLQERLRSESPPSRASQRASSASPSQQQQHQQQSFSREHIQNKIDTVRKRWFPDGSGEEGEGVRGPEAALAVEQPFQQIQGSPLKRPSADVPPVEEYGSSLDRLNGSLTELQGEIMRLSLQHDQIKTIVNDAHNPPTTKGLPEQGKPSESNDQFYLFPRAGGEVDVESERQSEPEPEPSRSPEPQPADSVPAELPVQSTPPHHGMAQPPASQPMYQSPGQPPMYPNQPYPGYPQMPPGQMPPGGMGQYPGYQGGMYPQQFPGMPPMYPQAQMYPPGHPMQGYPMYPQGQGQWQQPMPGMPPVSAMPPQSLMLPQAHTQTVSSNQGLPLQSPVAITSPERQVQSPAASYSSPQAPPAPHTPASPAVTQAPAQPPPVSTPPVTSPPQQEQEKYRPADPEKLPYTYAEEEDNQEGDPMNQSNEGFFVSFESDAPRKQKPKLPNPAERKKPGGKKEKPKPPPAAAPPPVAPVEPPVEVAPALGFVIGQDEQKTNEQAEIEKKKQRLMQLQMKRKEEMEKKRMKLEADRAKKNEEQRMKQEVAEAKKAEDKARREQIFQSYQQRKAEREAEEEISKSGMAPVKRRIKAKAPRPKSQPPGTMAIQDDGHSHSSQSHSSQEDIHMRGRSPAPELARSLLDPRKKRHSTGHLVSFPAGDKVDGGYQLAFGGLTHRRPPTPDRAMRGHLLSDRLKGLVGQPDGNGNGPHRCGEQEYTGPKLFVKPSQKSNKHIIVNAVSHCCLAGVVNGEVKNKVLDIIEKSEAKHFLILFRDAGQQYRGLYRYNPETEEVFKIQGVGPKQITPDMFERFYKYNSGAKSFTQISTTKHLSQTIDAVTIPNALWQKKPQTTQPRKPMY